MFGGDNNNPVFPVFLDQNRIQYNTNAMPQLQLFKDYAVNCAANPINYMGNDQITLTNQPIKTYRDTESFSRQQNLHMSLHNNDNNVFKDESGQVSTGLRLSYEEDDHNNSSVVSASESMTTAGIPIIFSSSNDLKSEIDRQKDEFEQFIKIQEENIKKGIREMKQRHTTTFLNIIERRIGNKLREKELEIESINTKNKQLIEIINQAKLEVQSWQHRAKHNESIANALKIKLNQILTQLPLQGKEGYGDSEIDDATSYTNAKQDTGFVNNGMNCRSCKVKEVNVLVLPCRHLCLCVDCVGFIDVCPVCKVMKTASVQVFMS